MTDADPVSAALAEVRERNEGRIEFYRYTDYTVEHDAAEGDVRRLLAALGAALKHHRPEHLYGSAATEGEPGACPHDPDSLLHFEAADGSGEWLCEGKPEGIVCSCTETSDGERLPYPCDEVADILGALTRKGG